MHKKTSILIIIIAILGSFFYAQPVYPAVDLIKAPNSSTVYYVDENNIRHAFPNQITYQSWFGNDFKNIMTMSEEYIASLPLGKNITLKSGKYLVKVPSRPEVYAVEPGGTLRHITSAEVAEKIYSNNWQEKLIDLPEVFFENYVIAKAIEYEHQIPDGVVYKLTGNNSYYYKTAGHVREFFSWQDVLDNGYNSSDVVEHITTFLLHAKKINGPDTQINNLIMQNNLTKYDCENKNLKGAFIFVYEDSYLLKNLDKIKNIKNKLPEYFNWATDKLSAIDLADEIFKIKKQDYHIVKGEFNLKQVTFDFYTEHPDVYDFLFIFDNFSPKTKTIAQHHLVTNQIKGINKSIFKAEVQYGSLGQLKGVINMFNIKRHSFTTENDQQTTLDRLTHEILHQWSGRLTFLNNDSQPDTSLFEEESLHWSNYVNFISPLGGLGWQDNGDGTFTYPTPEVKTKLADLDLYAMGLLPIRGIDEIFYIIPDEDEYGSTVEGEKVVVDPRTFITTMGEWECKIK